jgi:transcriptional regulator GlxA family with amidase domain
VPKITFLLCDNMLATSTTLPFEMLRAAESAARGAVEKAARGATENPARDKAGRHVEPLLIQTTAIDKQPVKTSVGFSLVPDTMLAEAGNSDIIYLPALWRNPRPIVKKGL